ncbi:hypothetical protein [Geoalkalibacter halelectricus]|uniref:Uncharacterized protein n=1 Tax=Geoalkalibacter halelectricus TaxID=2847045 RepID=A0ABY5ZJN8_9BACT|nr:hypothetical protein [Geoalkalibacter halelectricus]MDO3377729.1 hypothetical protein [Geoalkalibacter halelectricus]UWZ78674.1 hypothetical protein L9S41_13425 [Geoalkalibacter halelectricus]
MRDELIRVKLWDEGDGRNPTQDMVCAWSVLARLGAPYRFGGRAPDGQVEYLVLDPADGHVVASGRGTTPEEAMCCAALAARGAQSSH